MKRTVIALILVLALLLALFLAGCPNKISDEEELKRTAAGQLTCDILGSSDLGDQELIWFCFGGNLSERIYMPVLFEKTDDNQYIFIHAGKSTVRAKDIAYEHTLNGCSFLINNPDCKYIEITDQNGEKKLIEITEIPFVYYCEPLPYEYNFLDCEKNPFELH